MAPTRYATYVDRARKLSDEQLRFWLAHHQSRGNLVVAGAIRVVVAERKVAAQRDARLRAVFA